MILDSEERSPWHNEMLKGGITLASGLRFAHAGGRLVEWLGSKHLRKVCMIYDDAFKWDEAKERLLGCA